MLRRMTQLTERREGLAGQQARRNPAALVQAERAANFDARQLTHEGNATAMQLEIAICGQKENRFAERRRGDQRNRAGV